VCVKNTELTLNPSPPPGGQVLKREGLLKVLKVDCFSPFSSQEKGLGMSFFLTSNIHTASKFVGYFKSSLLRRPHFPS